MKRRLSLLMLIVGVALISGILTSTSFAQSEIWGGTFSFTVKSTSQETDNSGNDKFLTSNQSFEGTMSLYVGDNGLGTNAKGCYLELLGNDGTTICIKDIVGISTESQKIKSEKVLLVGTGSFTTTVEENTVTGIAYVDLKGTLKEDKSNNVVSIALSGKIGGGANEGSGNFVFIATLNNTILTKQSGP